MDSPGQRLLACTCLANDQNRGLSIRNAYRRIKHFQEGRRAPHDRPEPRKLIQAFPNTLYAVEQNPFPLPRYQAITIPGVTVWK